jgi:hypothetical protein
MKPTQFIKPLHLSIKKYLFLKPSDNKVVSVFLVINPHFIHNEILKGFLILLNENNEIPYVNKVFDNAHIDKYCKIDLKLQNFNIIKKYKVTHNDTDYMIYLILGNSNRHNFWLEKKGAYVWRDHYFTNGNSSSVNYKIETIDIDNHHILNLVESHFKK